MSKRIGLSLLAALALAACAIFNGPARVTLYAQSLPATVHAVWDPPAAAENVTGYTLTVDGGAPVNVANVTDPACSCIKAPITVGAFGAHSVSVVANNLLISGDPSSVQTSAPAVAAFTLAKAATVTGQKVVR